MKTIKYLLLSGTLVLTFLYSNAQAPLTLPFESQKSTIIQRIGLTDITIIYHGPSVKNRKIWGGLVPYNQIWRCGANENTIISFTSDVMVEGKLLVAGTYGLHMTPSENKWTIIFSKNYTSWGSFFYKKEEDALRVDVTPTATAFQECLSYSFADKKANSVTVELTWEKLTIPFKIEVDVNNVVLANIRNELRNLQGFSWEGSYGAANFCLVNNINYDEALKWIEQSIQIKGNFSNLQVKTGLLEKKGQIKEADEIRKKAFSLADENQLNQYGYKLLGENKTTEAIEIFKLNVKKYPIGWNVYDSLADAYQKAGDKKQALANYKLALVKAPDAQKVRIQDEIKKLL